ncbi:AAA family ATPase [Viridibacillus sp. NPDC093762]|uniref:AAA family ATPase n=1 Tax=Viridibacillus sp. NPDC093762 TaxID=3390720 RepID=UPI003CFD950D
MKLEFLWFAKYKQLTDFQANLGSQFKYSFESENNVLKVDKDSNYIEWYFSDIENTGIDITAIVGENGVGKSTIIDFILDFIKNDLFSTKYLIVFNDGSDRIIIQNITKEDQKVNVESQNDEIVIKKIGDRDEESNVVQKNKEVEFRFNVKDFKTQKHNMPKAIFFTNVFDVRYMRGVEKLVSSDSFEDDRYVEDTFFCNDISTNNLLLESENVVEFLNKEFEKQIYFIYDFINSFELLEIIKIPDYINVKLIESEMFLDIDIDDFYEFVEVFFEGDVIKDFFGFIPKSNLDEFQIEILENLLKKYLYLIDLEIRQHFINFYEEIPYVTYMYEETSFSMLEDAREILEITGEYREDDIFSFLPFLVEMYLHEYSSADLQSIKDLKIKLIKISDDIKCFAEKVSEIKFTYLNYDLELDTPSKNNAYISTSEDIKELIKNHEDVFGNNQLFNFAWTQLSSGEHGLLSLFGRIYSTFKDLQIKDVNDNSYLLLIDEGDLYFHPQWQKDWLYYFIQFLKVTFKEKVQLILTTHSPLVLSDFPNSNVLFVGGKDSINLEGSPRTLGANILELFANSFFLKDGLIGRYGKNQINMITREIISSTPKYVANNKSRYEAFIDNIGEPLVRNKLIGIFKDKVDLGSNSAIDERINNLETEIQLLKKMRMEE